MVSPTDLLLLVAIGFLIGFVVSTAVYFEGLLPQQLARAREQAFSEGYTHAVLDADTVLVRVRQEVLK